MKLMLPKALKRLMLPSEPTPTMTRFGTGKIDVGLMSEALGTVAPAGPGKMVTKVGVVALTAVTLATIAVAVLGMPSTLVTTRLRTFAEPPATAPLVQPWTLGLPFCVLHRRTGVPSAVNDLPVALNHPSMSTAMLIEPAPFQIETVQLPPEQVTGTMTRFETAACALTLRFDALGLVPVNAVNTVGTDGAMPVRLKTTAATPVP